MKAKATILTAAVVLALAMVACESGGAPSGGATYETPSAFELRAEADRVSARETAVAMQTRQAMESQARATADALDNLARATRQVLEVQATTQAVGATATAQTLAVARQATADAVEATAQAEAVQATRQAAASLATRTAEVDAATATVTARQDAIEATVAQATAQAVTRLERRERYLEPVRAVGWLLLLGVGAVLIGLGIIFGWRLFEDRARLVRRDPDEGEPVLLISRERLALPLRQFGAYADLTNGQERAPLLAPSVEAQEGVTMRQQTANALQARQVGRVAQARHGKAERVVIMPSERPQGQRRRSEAGLLGPVGRDNIPSRLLEGIVSNEWEVIE
jgi:hypothetical protein